MNRKQKKMLIRILAAAAMLIALHFIPADGILRLAFYLAVYLIIGYDILKKAGKGILNRQVFDENFLIPRQGKGRLRHLYGAHTGPWPGHETGGRGIYFQRLKDSVLLYGGWPGGLP